MGDRATCVSCSGALEQKGATLPGRRRARDGSVAVTRGDARGPGEPMNVKLTRGRIALASLLIGGVMFAGAVGLVRTLTNQEYRGPVIAEKTDPSLREQARKDDAEARLKADRERPYKDDEYRVFPKIGSRVAVWVVAQLHLLFAGSSCRPSCPDHRVLGY